MSRKQTMLRLSQCLYGLMLALALVVVVCGFWPTSGKYPAIAFVALGAAMVITAGAAFHQKLRARDSGVLGVAITFGAGAVLGAALSVKSWTHSGNGLVLIVMLLIPACLVLLLLAAQWPRDRSDDLR